MSSGERLFTPRSLRRVANAVDWEEDLVEYNDGTSNQSEYMTAMAILYERWMRGWALPDFLRVAGYLGKQEYVEAFQHVAESMKERIGQMLGFWRGIWEGANPRSRGLLFPTWLQPGQPQEYQGDIRNVLNDFVEWLIEQATPIIEEREGVYGDEE